MPSATPDEAAEPVADFAGLGLSDPVLRAVYDVGYETPSPIQAQAIGPLLQGHDILGQAQTGTGKTAAFALPLLSRIDLASVRPQLLILTPTRELTIQVAEALQTYARYLDGFHVLPVYGGQSMSLQLRMLRRGIHAVVGTPGRVLDHLRRGSLKLDGVTSVVLDEADEMLRMGFIDDVELILDRTPDNRQLALFSATLPASIQSVAERYTRDPVQIRIKSRTATVESVTQRYWQVSGLHKLDALTRVLETEDFDAMVVFVRTKIATTELADRLEARGFSSAPLNGDMNQATRELTIERLRNNRLDILVATDVAARGLDVERISHVVNYDIPYDTEAYVHRIGRTGRAGREGHALLFVAPRERRMLRAIERATGQTITPMNVPTYEDVAHRRIERFKASITEVLQSQDLEMFRRVIASYQAEHDTPFEDLSAALAYMAQGDRPLLAPQDKTAQREARRAERDTDRPRPEHRDGGDKPARSKRARASDDGDLVSYRLEVGASHGVKPKNIVGAIANEAGLDSAYIGAVDIQDTHTIVQLPDGMPPEIFKHLRNVRVCGQALKLSVLGRDGEAAPDAQETRPDTRKPRAPKSHKPKKAEHKHKHRKKDGKAKKHKHHA